MIATAAFIFNLLVWLLSKHYRSDKYLEIPT